MTSLADKWTNELKQQDSEDSGRPKWVADLRKAGAVAFSNYGLPHRKVEDWKYTPLKLLEARSHRLAQRETETSAINGEWPDALLDSQNIALQFRNGVLNPDFRASEQILIYPLEDALADSSQLSWLEDTLSVLPFDGAARAFSALNTSMLDHGVVIHVPAGTDGGTLLVQYSFDDASPAMLFNTRVIIRLEQGARLQLVEQFESCAPEGKPARSHALNLVSQVDIGKGASFSHLRVQQESDETMLITRTECDIHDDAKFESSLFDWGGALVRHDNQVRLLGTGASATINGAFLQDGSRHIDHHVLIDHVAGGCKSDQFFRGVLGGKSRGVFNGKALIREGADGSSVRQSNANLLLSPMAEINTKPELEIYADEVEASHGATVGQLDRDAIFYLRSRGLSEEASRNMLTSAFCGAVLERAIEQHDSSECSDIRVELENRLAAALTSLAAGDGAT